jgi:hypothetical protein
MECPSPARESDSSTRYLLSTDSKRAWIQLALDYAQLPIAGRNRFLRGVQSALIFLYRRSSDGIPPCTACVISPLMAKYNSGLLYRFRFRQSVCTGHHRQSRTVRCTPHVKREDNPTRTQRGSPLAKGSGALTRPIGGSQHDPRHARQSSRRAGPRIPTDSAARGRPRTLMAPWTTVR